MITIGICIPTYQRGIVTRDSIIKIYNNNKELFDTGLCHFYISDDCSKDDTYEILHSLSNTLGCITLKRTEKNLGFEGNNGRCIQMCQKDYAWMLGDDDTINVKISKVIEKIDAINKPDFVIIGKNDSVEEKTYIKKEEAIRNLLYESTWMSGLIYKTSIVKFLDFNRYAEGEFPQTGAIFEYFGTHNSSIQYIYGKDYASILRPGVISYADRILEIYAKAWTNLVMGLPLSYDYKLKMELLKMRKENGNIMSNLVLMSLRARGELDKTTLKEYYYYIKIYNRTPYIFLYLISIMPKGILQKAREKYAKIKKIPLIRNG